MKNIILRILCALVAIPMATLNLMAQEPVKISGKSDRKYAKTAVLYKIVAGASAPIAQSDIQADGTFGFLFTPQYEGMYMLGTVHEESLPQDPRGKIDLYFKGGEEMEVNLTDSLYYMTGKKLSKENKVMYKWYQESYSLMTKAIEFGKVLSTYVDFFPELNRINNLSSDFVKKNKTGNKTFDAYFPVYMKWSTMNYAINLIVTPRKAHPTIEEWDPFYTQITTQNLTKNADDVYRFPWGVRMLGSVQNIDMRRLKRPAFRDMDFEMSQTMNDTLKGDVVVKRMELIPNQNRQLFETMTTKYGQYILTDVQKAKAAVVETKMAQLKSGDAGLNFEMEDVNGKKVKFADLKGKVVLVDVWATWCAPCKTEIPFLKKIEEEFKGTDLEVVSISIDVNSDKAKWQEMVEKEQLGGIQLFTNGDQTFQKYYKIQSIPRFMLFDRDGKIITLNSARPSNPDLKKQIQTLLNRK